MWLTSDPQGVSRELVERTRASVRDIVPGDAAVEVSRLLVAWRTARGANYLDADAESALGESPPAIDQIANDLARTNARQVIAQLEAVLARSSRLHELQHVLDERAGRGIPAAPLACIGDDPWLAATEVSAYTATLWRDPDLVWITLAGASALIAGAGDVPDATTLALACMVDELARHFEVTRPRAVDAGRIDKRRLSDAMSALVTRDGDELARSAGALWEGWFGTPLDEIELVGF
jgi:hypothetical protein